MSQDNPLISVITPTYNRAELLAEAIGSIQVQTLRDYEHLIVDDGSQDETAEVVAGFDDPRIIYLSQPQKGVAAARNLALSQARGRIFLFLDSDDLALPDRLQNQVDTFTSQPEAGLVYGVYYAERFPWAARIKISRCEDAPPPVLEELVLKTVFHWSTVALRAEWIERIGPFDEQLRIGEEWDLTLRLALAGCKMVCFPQPLSVVRMQPVSLSREMPKHLESSMKVLDKTFNAPDFPRRLRKMKDLACEIQLLRTATVALLTGHDRTGRDYFRRALSIDADMLDAHADFTAANILGVVLGFSPDEPIDAVDQILASLARLDLDIVRLADRLHLRIRIWEAFAAREIGSPALLRRKVLEVFRIEPLALLKNRGLVSIYFKSFFTRNEVQDRPDQ